MVWLVGREKGENGQGALGSGEVKRLDQEGARPSPCPSVCTLGFPGLSFALTTT